MSGLIEKTAFPLSGDKRFDEVIDVRSPVEFELDHISGAINLPVLSDSERVEVGTIYRQESSFKARQIGAALVSRNIAAHLEQHFSEKGKHYVPLLYCWRGGQRSQSLATVLTQIGWQVHLIDGGYRGYRKHVVSSIAEKAESLRLVVLDGLTGAGKTLILKQLAAQGQQILDLEGLARHKGSVFGGDPSSPQPAQKRFESLLYDQLCQFSTDRPVFVEAESAKIGKLNLPNSLWQMMRLAEVIELTASRDCRAQFIESDYGEWLGDLDRVHTTIDRLQGFHSKVQIEEWKQLAEQRQWLGLISSLLAKHYDQRYRGDGNKRGHFQVPFACCNIDGHEQPAVEHCAAELVSLVV